MVNRRQLKNDIYDFETDLSTLELIDRIEE